MTESDVRPLTGCFDAGTRDEQSFDAGIEHALQCMLVQPDFLFRVERDTPGAAPGTAYRISDLELASRLSFFLWSSIPDDQLRDLATRRRLSEPAVLEQQVRRMLADPRAHALVENFAGQWLWLRNLRTVSPNSEQYPRWEDSLRLAMQQETELFFESMIREDRGVPELLDANYTFLNQRLAEHYGISNVYGSHFRRVTLGDDQAFRRGLLGQASILTVTSHENRTSPVKRGKWILENMLGTPPPPPPPDVPSLNEEQQSRRPMTMRQRMEEHRKNPACASCHATLDPLGLAMENFDGVGEWRTQDGGAVIDPSVQLPDGTMFKGPGDVRALLLNRREEFVRTVTDKLMTYALGRGTEYYDRPIIRRIVKDTAGSGYKWSAIIMGIVKSPSFQMRKVAGPPAAATASATAP